MVLPITVRKSYVAEKGKSTKGGSTGDTGDPRIETTRKAIPRWCYSSAQIGHPSKYLFWEVDVKCFALDSPRRLSATDNNSGIYQIRFADTIRTSIRPDTAPWHQRCVQGGMFVDKLQGGFLLFETQQGWVGVELTPRQRICLLWTYRHFRQLSMPLLNGRERTLVNELFRNADVMPQSYNPSLVIGVVEKFVPPPPSDAPPAPQPAPRKGRKVQVAAPSAKILP